MRKSNERIKTAGSVTLLDRSTELRKASDSKEDQCDDKGEKALENFNEGKRSNSSFPLLATFCLV